MNSVKVVIEALITHYLFQILVYLGLFDVFWFFSLEIMNKIKIHLISYHYLTKFLVLKSKFIRT